MTTRRTICTSDRRSIPRRWPIRSALLVAAGFAIAAGLSSAGEGPLAAKLQVMREQSAKKTPADKAAVAREALEQIRRAGVLEGSLKVGQKAPEFTLPNAHGKRLSSKQLLSHGPLIVAFYRGHW